MEVFSEQDVRFALLPVGEFPPGGSHERIQRVELSDDRWLELSLTFDGLGLNGQVAYFDPALAQPGDRRRAGGVSGPHISVRGRGRTDPVAAQNALCCFSAACWRP